MWDRRDACVVRLGQNGCLCSLCGTEGMLVVVLCSPCGTEGMLVVVRVGQKGCLW